MSNVIATPEIIASAATDLVSIGANLGAAHTTAAVSTLAVRPAAADEVSVTIADFFSRHAQDYQARAGQAAAFGQRFVETLGAGAGAYAAAEAANAAVLAPAGPITNAITTVWGDIQNFLNSALTTFEQILNQFSGFLLPLIENAIAFSVAFFFGFVLPAVEIALNILVIL